MRTTILLCSLLLLTACQGSKQSETGKQAAKPMGGSDDAPIVVADGSSIHIRSKRAITFTDDTHAYVNLGSKDAKTYEMSSCTLAADSSIPDVCFSHPSQLPTTAPWTLKLSSDANCSNTAATLSFAAANQVDIEVPANSSLEKPNNNGIGIKIPGVNLLCAKRNLDGNDQNPDMCATSTTKKCAIKIGN